MSQTQRTLALYQELIFKSVFYEKDAYGTLGSFVACFGRFSAEDEQKPKLVYVHPQIALW